MARNKPHQMKNTKSRKLKGSIPGPHKKHRTKKRMFDTRARLIVRNLSFKTSEGNLKQHFDTYGKVAEVKLLKRPNGDLVGCGFVQFEDIAGAKQALSSTNSKPFLGRSIQVDWALPKDQFEADMKKPLISNEDNTHKNEYEAESNVENDTHIISKNNRKRDREINKKSVEDKTSQVNCRIVKKARLIVRNVSFKATEESLKEHFAQYGEVIESSLLKKPNGELVGCGFIQMKNVKDAAKAILKTNAHTFLGRAIHVDWAVAKNKYMSYITQKKDEEELLKNDVKSEPESDDDSDQGQGQSNIVPIKQESDEMDKSESDNESDTSNTDMDSDAEMESDEVDDMHSQLKPQDDSLKVSANDAEDGKTVFLKNVPFSITNEDLEEFIRPFGEVQYALVCIDKLKEHSKGTAFVRFKNKEDADMFLSSGPDILTIEEQTIEAFPAMFRDRIKGTNVGKKQPKDSRNLYLIKEGVILANSKAAVGVSASDIAKRLTLEQNKSQILRNLNRFISRYRLTIHNLPLHYKDEDLRKLCLEMANVKPYCLKECRVMKHLKGPMTPDGKHISKGYGFVMFTRHEDALTCLRRLNNHPSVFDKNNRPIVSFSIEDRAVLNARKKRLEKSQMKNPHSKSYVSPPPADAEKDSLDYNNKSISSRQSKNIKKNIKTKSVKPEVHSVKVEKSCVMKEEGRSNLETYTGEVAKPGNTRMRSKFKLRNEAMMHRENVKKQKRKKRSAKRIEYVKKKEKIKQPKQKQNTNTTTKNKIFKQQNDDRKFTDLVNKYKSKLISSSHPQKVKTKWFEQC